MVQTLSFAPILTQALPSDAPTTLVVDGNYLLKCSYHATSTSPKYTVNGRHIGAVCEFIRKLRWLIGEHRITKCVVFWDGEAGGKLRYNIYPYYKANRKNKSWYKNHAGRTEAQVREEERSQRSLESQKVRIQTYLEDLYIRQTEQNLMEGDDMMAYYCQQFHQQERIIVFTNDRDMCQMLTLNGVQIYMDNLRKLINCDNFDLEFPYYYANAAVVKIMCGDASDNIKGVVGLGEKTLYNEFPDVCTRRVTVDEIRAQACAHTAARVAARQKPLKVMENICDGVAMRTHYGEEAPYAFGDELYRMNAQLMDLSEPMLTREAREEVLYTGRQVLNPAERGLVNILPLLKEDWMMQFYRNDLRYFAEPFLPLVVAEKARHAANALLA